MAASSPLAPTTPPPPPRLPLDVIHNIGLMLAADPLEETRRYMRSDYALYLQPLASAPCASALRCLTYLSHATRDVLEPLLYRHLTLTTPQQVTSIFITLIQKPKIRPHVQYIACFAQLTGPPVRKHMLPRCRQIWNARCETDKAAFIRLLDQSGLHFLAWGAAHLERAKSRFMFNADFKHDAILELMFAAVLFLTPNVTTFIWRDTNTKPVNVVMDTIMGVGIRADYPLMPNLQYLNTEKAAFHEAKQAPFFTSHVNLWDNLTKLYINDVDFDKEFIEMLIKGDFDENRPVKELYIRCVSGGESPGDVNSFGPQQVLPGTQLLDEQDPDQDRDKFKAFPNLDLLHVRFAFHDPRAQHGSPTLRAFLHAVGAPERLVLSGHPLPLAALDTGVAHPRLKYLGVREVLRTAPPKTESKDSLVLKLNHVWSLKSELVPNLPNLCAIDWDHYQFRRKGLEGEDKDKALWFLEGEDEWEDESGASDDDLEMDPRVLASFEAFIVGAENHDFLDADDYYYP
ncbi:hypothetical protein F66182_475 [Fusarium sp. NRRL 66182]|nr:hypothetical protein F66182_475 [Fusarium sp. NRRL 66182]